MMERLDPKLDVTFKLLFTRNEELLRAMLEAILDQPIASLEVLNPKVEGELVADKSIEFDVRVQLANGMRVDVEMQIRFDDTLPDRFVYYLAREHATQLTRGAEYGDLTPAVSVIWIVEPLFPELKQLHSVFELRERRTQRLFSSQLAIHLLQLEFIDEQPAAAGTPEPEDEGSAARREAVWRWGRFLLARTDAELEALAKEDPIMSAARSALDELSQDPEAARVARERADAIKLHEFALARRERKAREEGEREGRREGEREGRTKGKRETLLSILASRSIVLTADAQARIASENEPATLDRWILRALGVVSIDQLFERE